MKGDFPKSESLRWIPFTVLCLETEHAADYSFIRSFLLFLTTVGG